ncbi:MAG TPA: hypothetical protein VHZ02_08435 [Acidimicrobiales bacterium]|nr:hypothetical protein [Acidimicrobiales bacterium]
MAKPLAYVCHGKKCSRACDHDALLRALCKQAEVRLVRCQKICHGSVVVTRLDGGLEWFEGVDTPRSCVDMKRAVVAGTRKKLPPRLKRRRLKKRAGTLPR